MKRDSRIQNTDHQNSSSFSNWFLISIDSAMPLWNYHQDLSGLTSHSRSGTEPRASSVTILGLTHNQCERWMQKDHLIFLSSASCCFLFILKIIFLCTIESEWMVQILLKIPTKSFRTLWTTTTREREFHVNRRYIIKPTLRRNMCHGSPIYIYLIYG